MKSNLENVEGLNLLIVASGDEALAEVKKSKFDWIISDYELPGSNSMEYFHKLVNLTLGTNIIVLSGKLTPEIKTSLGSLGIKNFIEKPFDPIKLIEQLKG